MVVMSLFTCIGVLTSEQYDDQTQMGMTQTSEIYILSSVSTGLVFDPIFSTPMHGSTLMTTVDGDNFTSDTR